MQRRIVSSAIACKYTNAINKTISSQNAKSETVYAGFALHITLVVASEFKSWSASILLSSLLPEVLTRLEFAVTQQNYNLCTPHFCGVEFLDSRLSWINSERIIA